jgi:hypothetical protein
VYVNGKMRSADTIPGIEGRGIKETGRGGEFNYDIFDNMCKNFCKSHNVSPPSTTIKKGTK